MCTHMGCPVAYDAEQRVFKCGCHFSMFDAEKGGQIVCGQATENLPRIVLNYNSNDDTVPRSPSTAFCTAVNRTCCEEISDEHATDRIALPPVNAQQTNLTCHFCIVGAAITSTSGRRTGGRERPARERIGTRFSQAATAPHHHDDTRDGQYDYGKDGTPLQHPGCSGQDLSR